MSRRVGIIGIVVLVALVATIVLRTQPPRRPAVSREQFSRITEGMSRREVEAIIGGPPGDYATRRYCTLESGIRYHGWQKWVGDRGMLFVRFEKADRADAVEYVSDGCFYLDEPTFFERIRAWLGG